MFAWQLFSAWEGVGGGQQENWEGACVWGGGEILPRILSSPRIVQSVALLFVNVAVSSTTHAHARTSTHAMHICTHTFAHSHMPTLTCARALSVTNTRNLYLGRTVRNGPSKKKSPCDKARKNHHNTQQHGHSLRHPIFRKNDVSPWIPLLWDMNARRQVTQMWTAEKQQKRILRVEFKQGAGNVGVQWRGGQIPGLAAPRGLGAQLAEGRWPRSSRAPLG